MGAPDRRFERAPSPYAERVLAVVEQVPPGRVMTYGDVCEWLGESSARGVGVVMSLHGHEVPWWRVVLSTGAPAPVAAAEALARLVAEGVPLTKDRQRVDLRQARWDGRS